jgi:transcriptional regulator with XRE-family HTH domain
MSKSSAHNDWLPPQAHEALRALGSNLALARHRRKESLRDWAQRIGVSVRTLQRLEAGDPGVGMGIYAAALWLMGRAQALPDLADPALDRGALALNVREAQARQARRAAVKTTGMP